MLRELFDNNEWSMLKRQNEELCEKAGSLPEEIPFYNIPQVSPSDTERESIGKQNGR